MKKTLLTLLIMASFPVLAQTTVTAPSPNTAATPNIGVLPVTDTALTQSATNRVFVDQYGERPDVSVTQTGSGNTAGSGAGAYAKDVTVVDRLNAGGTRAFSVTNPIYLRGHDQDIILLQQGNNNTISLRAVSPNIANQGVNISIEQLGSSNFADLDCGIGASTGGASLTGCKSALVNWEFTGNSNAIQFRGTGDDLNSQITVNGNSNEINIDSVGNKHNQTMKVAGDFNVFHLSQTGNSTYGSSIWMDVTGSSNRFFVSQSGSQDNVVKITSVGSSGLWNIIQRTTQ